MADYEIKEEMVLFEFDYCYIHYDTWKLVICVKFDYWDNRSDFDFEIDIYDFFHTLKFAPMEEWFRQRDDDELPSNELVYQWLLEINDESNKELYNERYNRFLELIDHEHYKYWHSEDFDW